MATERFRISPETNRIIARLSSVAEGETVTYSEISDLIGGDVQNGRRHFLDSARRIMKDQGIVFGAVFNVGVKRLSDDEKVIDGERGIKSIRRQARKNAKTIACVNNFSGLSQEMKTKHNTALSVLGAISLFTRHDKIKKISHEVAVKNDQLLIGETMRLFGNKS